MNYTAKRAEILKKAEDFKAKIEGEDRDFTDDELVTFEGFVNEATELKSKIEKEKKINALSANLDTSIKDLENVPAPKSVETKVEFVQDNREKDPQCGWEHFGEFAASVSKAMTPSIKQWDERFDVLAAVTGMGQSVGSDGGFTVPPAFVTAVWDGLNNPDQSLMARTETFTVSGDSLTLNANAETSRANGSRYGGIRGYWIAEAAQMTASFPKLRQIKIEPQQMAVFVYVTDKLLNNSQIALSQYLTNAASSEIMFMTNDAIINGSGAGQPLGILNSNCTVSVAKTTGQAAATLTKTNIEAMWARMHAAARPGAVWFINQDIEPQLFNLNQVIGTGGVPVFLPQGGLSASPFATLFNRPIIPIESCATLGTVGDIILADLGFYVTGTRGGVASASSIHLRFDYNETAFRFLFEVDGQPWLNSALTPFKGSNTTSPFITLATRA